MLELYFCSHCHDQLCSYGEIADVVFSELCAYYLENGAMELRYFDPKMSGVIQIIDFLEKKGYVVTADINLEIYAKPCGVLYEPMDDREIFTVCIHRDFHENEFED